MKPRAFVLLAALVAAAPGLCAEKPSPKTLRLRWQDLDSFVAGHRINLALPSDIWLEGDVLGVRDDGLVRDVKVTSDKRAYPRGRALVPRAEVGRFRLIRTRGKTWGMVGPAAGGGLGLLVGLAGSQHTGTPGPAVATGLVTAAGAWAGFLCGLAADHARTEVIVQPEPGQPGVLA
jgi:hypothetical protein